MPNLTNEQLLEVIRKILTRLEEARGADIFRAVSDVKSLCLKILGTGKFGE